MLLQDNVACAPPLLIQSRDGRIHDLSGAASLAKEVVAAPVRYVLDDASAALITQSAFSEQSATASCLDLVRFPAKTFWIEWSEASRAKLLGEYGLIDPFQEFRLCKRAGALVEADDSGRRGVIRILWENGVGEADLSPFIIEFDLDDTEFSRRGAGDALTRSIRIEGLDVVEPVMRHVRFRMTDDWRKYYATYAHAGETLEEIVEQSLLSIAGDFPYIAAFCLILAARGALQFSRSQLDKLNASRAKNDKPQLLDHITVSLALFANDERGVAYSPSVRSAARLHHVCGHIVRRDGGIHWRRAHMRGKPNLGIVSARTIHVRAG